MKKFNLKNLTTFCLSLFIINTTTFASATGEIKNFFTKGSNNSTTNLVTNFGSNILGILTYAGYIGAICVILVTGVRFIIASPQKKAELKGKLWAIALGVILLVCGIPIFNLLVDLFEKLGDSII